MTDGCNDCASDLCRCPHQEDRFILLLLPAVVLISILISMCTKWTDIPSYVLGDLVN